MSKEYILEEIIEGYRKLIRQRYQYEDIVNQYEIPESIDEETVCQIRDFFLNYIYPEFSKRKELNVAFESLDSYIKRPEKLFRMLMDSIKLFFSHGRHLPKILRAGLKALKSFRAASSFENKLAEAAIENEMHPPFDKLKINTLLKYLSRSEIEKFIEISESLVLIFHDKKLILEVKEILDYLIKSMREKQRLYSINEVKGLELGLEMIVEGNKLFDQFSLKDQQLLIQLIIKIERGALNNVFQGE